MNRVVISRLHQFQRIRTRIFAHPIPDGYPRRQDFSAIILGKGFGGTDALRVVRAEFRFSISMRQMLRSTRFRVDSGHSPRCLGRQSDVGPCSPQIPVRGDRKVISRTRVLCAVERADLLRMVGHDVPRPRGRCSEHADYYSSRQQTAITPSAVVVPCVRGKRSSRALVGGFGHRGMALIGFDNPRQVKVADDARMS